MFRSTARSSRRRCAFCFRLQRRMSSASGRLSRRLCNSASVACSGGQASHLELTESDEPANRLEGGGARRRYVLLYDKVPGGTGQLAHIAEPETFEKLLRVAHRALTTCECQRGESERDGCYLCLFAYQVQRDLPILSSHAAREMIDQVLEQFEGGELTPTGFAFERFD